MYWKRAVCFYSYISILVAASTAGPCTCGITARTRVHVALTASAADAAMVLMPLGHGMRMRMHVPSRLRVGVLWCAPLAGDPGPSSWSDFTCMTHVGHA